METEPGVWRRTGLPGWTTTKQDGAAHLPSTTWKPPRERLSLPTPLGGRRAELTGVRLASLALRPREIERSSKTEATETTTSSANTCQGPAKLAQTCGEKALPSSLSSPSLSGSQSLKVLGRQSPKGGVFPNHAPGRRQAAEQFFCLQCFATWCVWRRDSSTGLAPPHPGQ